MAEKELNIQHIFTRMAKKVILDRKNHSATARMLKGIAADTKNAANPAYICPTSKGLIYIHPSGEPVNLEMLALNSELMGVLHMSGKAAESSEEARVIIINPHIKGGKLQKCMFSLIEDGESRSRKLLNRYGVSIEKIDIRTNADLANYSSDKLMNILFGVDENIEKVREAIDAVKVRIFALQAAKLLRQDEKIAKFIAELKTVKVSAPCAELMAFWKKIDNIAKMLSIVPQIKIQGQAQGEFLTPEELASDFSVRLKNIQAVIPERITTIQHEMNGLQEIIGWINEGHLGQALKKAVDTFQTLDENLSDINISTKRTTRLLDALVNLAIEHTNNAIPVAAKEKAFKDKRVNVTLEKEPEPEIPPEMAGRVNILIADDEEAIREILQKRFEALGFKVVTAECGEAALIKFNQEHFDLIISDLSMDKMDGVDLIRAVKKLKPHIHAHIVSATPHHLAPNKLHALTKEDKEIKFIPKDLSNIAQILKLGVHLAQKKAGLEITDTAVQAPEKNHKGPSFASSKELLLWNARLSHKLNNNLGGLMGYLDLILHSSPKESGEGEFTAKMCESIEHCNKIVEQLKTFAEKHKSPLLESVGFLPVELQKDEAATNVITQIRTDDGPEYVKLYEITAVTAILYSPVLAMMAEHLEVYKRQKDRTELNKAWSLVISLQSFNEALTSRIPANHEMKLASNTIEYLMK